MSRKPTPEELAVPEPLRSDVAVVLLPLAEDADARSVLDASWAEYLSTDPDLGGNESFYESNWQRTLGLDPEEVRLRVTLVAEAIPIFGSDARSASAALRRASSEAYATGEPEDEYRAFSLEEAAEAYAAGGWEVRLDGRLVPGEFAEYLASEASGTLLP